MAKPTSLLLPGHGFLFLLCWVVSTGTQSDTSEECGSPGGRAMGNTETGERPREKIKSWFWMKRKRFLECFNYLGISFFLYFSPFQNLESVHVQEDNPFTIT